MVFRTTEKNADGTIKIHNTEEIARVLQILDYHIRVFILWKSYYISLT